MTDTTGTPLTEINFDETGPITLDAFIAEHKGLSMTCERVQSRPDGIEWDKGARHFKCLLKNEGRQATIYFSQGSAHKEDPTLEDVLSAMASDAHVILNCEDAADVMKEFGYEDAKEARRVFKGCQKAKEDLERLFPETAKILIEHTEHG